MRLSWIDFETYWSTTHSLSKMLPAEYVMHPETELISCSITFENYPVDVIFGEPEITRVLKKHDFSDTMLIAHNMSLFDCMILAWRLGIHPKAWGCTLAMARPKHGNTTGLSLAKLVAEYELGVKNNSALMNTRGKHLKDFTPAEIEAMRVYNRDDTSQCRALFHKLRPLVDARELWIIDSTIRMLTEPKFKLHQPMLRKALQMEKAKKRKSLFALGELLGYETTSDEVMMEDAVRGALMSAPKFSALLESLDVEVPMKPSPKDPDKLIPALAKTDPEFVELMEHENPIVAAAAQARLEAKSTLLETRIETFLIAADSCGGYLPIPANYYGAHTGRDSGAWYNALNLPRITWNNDGTVVPKLTNALRMSLLAPEGQVVLVADLSGIELRLNHTLWRVPYSMAMWKASPTADLYRATAAKYYALTADDITKLQRQFGKVLQLACGFGIGPPKFKKAARTMGGLHITDEEAYNGVHGWRNLHPEIADRESGGWAMCDRALQYIAAGKEWQIDPWGLAVTCAEGIRLTCDDRLIRYPDLRAGVNEKTGFTEWKYGQGRNTKYIYGGKVDENIIQALGRTVLMDNVIEFFKRTGLRPALRVYDEPAYVVPEKEAPALLAELLAIMRTPPKWWPELVVWSEGEFAKSYGLAK